MFNTLVTSISSLMSRGFWLGAFLPVLLAVMAHVTLAEWLLHEPALTETRGGEPAQDGTLGGQAEEGSSDGEQSEEAASDGSPLGGILSDTGTLATLSGAFVVLIAVAFAFDSLLPLMRGVLDGSLLPDWLHEEMRRRRVLAARRLRDGNRAADTLLGRTDDMARNGIPRLWAARAEGQRLAHANAPAAIEKAERAVAAAAALHQSADRPDADVLDRAIKATEAALQANAVGLPPGHQGHPLSLRVEKVADQLTGILVDSAFDASARSAIRAARYALTEIDRPQATRFGDARHIAEQRCLDLYGIDFDFLWPRIGAHLPDDGPELLRLKAAQAGVDFAVLSFWLSLTIPVVWLPVILASDLSSRDATFPLVLVAPVTIVLVTWSLYDLAVQSQFAFAATVKTAVDRHRFKVLADLHVALPPTLSAERRIWQRLRSIEARAPSEAAELVFTHAPDAGGAA